MTIYDLDAFVISLEEQPGVDANRGLEEYLRALWRLVQENRPATVSYDWVATALKQSFSVDPVPFDEVWLESTEPPDERRVKDDFEFLRGVLLFQIADLRRMAENGQLQDPHRYFGIQSP